jgi:hypothetical protein
MCCVVEDENICDSCCKEKELSEFICRNCHNKFYYCKMCSSIAVKENKCIDCYEEGL